MLTYESGMTKAQTSDQFSPEELHHLGISAYASGNPEQARNLFCWLLLTKPDSGYLVNCRSEPLLLLDPNQSTDSSFVTWIGSFVLLYAVFLHICCFLLYMIPELIYLHPVPTVPCNMNS